MIIDIQHAGEVVDITFEANSGRKVTIILAVADAADFAAQLATVTMLGGSGVTDKALHSMIEETE